MILEPFIEKKKITPFLKTLIIKIFDNYLNEIYLNGNEEDIFEYFKARVTVKQYEKLELILGEYDETLLKVFKKLCMVVENTKIIDKLDHRLIYLFLKYHYGNDRLTKILWNIEMKSMSGEDTKIDYMQERLKKIHFEDSLITDIIFTKASGKSTFKKGKIL
jgi:hypothetical protein